MIPPEWHRHTATQLHWPSNQNTWTAESLGKLEALYSKLIEELHFFEPIHLFVENLEVRSRVMQKLAGRAIDLDRVVIHQHKINDIWARQSGPIFGKNEQEYVILVGNGIPKYIAEKFGIRQVELGMTLTGDSIDVNGAGVLLTTEPGLRNLNPELSIQEMEHQLKEKVGIGQVIWLKKGVGSGRRGAQVDNVARWLNEETVLAMVSENKKEEYYHSLQENLKILRQVRLQNGRKLNIETLPLLHTKMEGTSIDSSEFVLASYANFYIANGVVLVPVFDHQYDERAMDLFKKYFPGRKVIGINCKDLLQGYNGTIHSITQQWYGVR